MGEKGAHVEKSKGERSRIKRSRGHRVRSKGSGEGRQDVSGERY